jgi:arylsulfatase A-like enzyme
VLGGNSQPLISDKRSTLASLLKQENYNTACIGKWHLGLGWQKDSANHFNYEKAITHGPLSVGFDYFYGISASLDMPPYVYIENKSITADAIEHVDASKSPQYWRAGAIGNDFKHEEVLPHLTDKAVNYIRQQAKAKQPFFLYFPLPSPHTPILPTAQYLGKSGLNLYVDFVLMTDDMVGRVLQAVKDAGIENNTIIVFTSDNGVSPQADLKQLETKGHYSSYIFRGTKADIYEGGHRIPFMVKWPAKVAAGGYSTAAVSLTDWMATTAAITKHKLADDEGEDSFNLLPLLTQGEGYKRNRYIINHSINGNFAIRKGKWKLVFAYGSGGWSQPNENQGKQNKLPPVQLFDLNNEVSEKENLANRYPRVVKRLTKQLEKIINQGRSTFGKAQTNDVKVNYLKYK